MDEVAEHALTVNNHLHPEHHSYKTYNKVSDNQKELIYSQFREYMVVHSNLKELCTQKGGFSLQKNEGDAILVGFIDKIIIVVC